MLPRVAFEYGQTSCAARSSASPCCGQLNPWTSFVTNCYTGGTPQTPLTAGTMIEQASVLVPGLQTDLPFNVCLVDIAITP